MIEAAEVYAAKRDNEGDSITREATKPKRTRVTKPSRRSTIPTLPTSLLPNTYQMPPNQPMLPMPTMQPGDASTSAPLTANVPRYETRLVDGNVSSAAVMGDNPRRVRVPP